MKFGLAAVLAALLALNSCECADNKNRNECQISNKYVTMNNVSSEDLAGISKTLDLYVKAAVEGDSKIARPAFAEGATMSHVENDSLVCLPIQALFDYYDATGKHQASYEIAECNVAGDVAMVRIESVFGEVRFTDMFTLAKTVSGWIIVSKIFTVK